MAIPSGALFLFMSIDPAWVLPRMSVGAKRPDPFRRGEKPQVVKTRFRGWGNYIAPVKQIAPVTAINKSATIVPVHQVDTVTLEQPPKVTVKA